MKKRLLLILILLSCIAAFSSYGQPVAVTKTNTTKVYMHYMPWFDAPQNPVAGGTYSWGWHWTMNNKNPNIVDASGKRQIASHNYPLIGPYASIDPAVVEYHLLLMKLSGVDGVLVDWYGSEGSNGDVGSLLNNSNAFINKTADAGIQFALVIEDRFWSNIQNARNSMTYAKNNYFNKSNFIKSNNAPLVGVFGPITYQTPSQWTDILSYAGQDVEFLPLWYENGDAGTNADGEYAWIYSDYLTGLNNFYANRAPGLKTAMGVAYPGFHDYYAQGGAGSSYFYIPENNGATLNETLAKYDQYKSNLDFLQLATWNDFGEGTIFEPTLENGYKFLVRIQQYTGVPYTQSNLEQVYRLFTLRKKYLNDATKQSQLNQVFSYFASLQIANAISLMNTVDNGPTQTQSPYSGIPAPIPGRIEAENYDNGGQGLAYNDNDATNNGNQYRTTEGVDVETCSEGGYNVGWTNPNEWIKYTVNVAAAGTYTLQARVASGTGSKTFYIELDGANISGTLTVPNTGGWQTWQTLTVTTPALTTGQKVMRIVMSSNDFNINYLTFVLNSNAPVVSSAAAATGKVATAFTYSITASNSPTSYGAASLPAGLSVNTSTGVISGTPTTAGTYTSTVSATNASGTGNKTVTITINPAAPVVSSSATASGTAGTAFTYTITANNNPTSYGATGLPSGLTVNTSTGVISGTPTTAGTYTSTVSATNAGGTGNKSVTFTISPAAPVVSSSATASGTAGTAFTYTITANNNPTSYGATGLPSGLTVNTSTGVISGTPTTAGTYTSTVSATNATGTGTKAVTITITAAGAPAGVITCYRAPGAITINGNLNETGWNITRTFSKKVTGTTNNTATFGVLWDNNNLYIAMKVLDANLYSESTNIWDDDAVEVYFDANYNKSATYDGRDNQIIKGYNKSTVYTKSAITGLQHAWAPVSGGYVVEMAVPWSQLGITTPAAGTNIGFDVGYDDDDNGGARDGQAVWNGTINNYQNTSAFGRLTLSAAIASGNISRSSNPVTLGETNQGQNNISVKMFPNPVTNGQLTVTAPGMNGNVTAQITDTKGSLMQKENKNVQNEKLNINVSHLKGGVYILQLRNSDKIITGKFMVK